MPIAVDGEVYDNEVQMEFKRLGLEMPTEQASATEGGVTTPSSGGGLESPTEPTGALKSTEGTKPPGRIYISPEPPKRPEDLPNIDDVPHHDWVESTLKSAWEALKAPGDALAGRFDPNTEEGVRRATDMAGWMIGAPAPVAGKLADGTLGSFAGVTSKTLDRSKLSYAQLEKSMGKHPDDVYQNTGFFQGADGRWRYEIPDDKSKVNIEHFDEDTSGNLITPRTGKTDFFGKRTEGLKLQHVLDHPELYKAYPWLADKDILPMPSGMKGISGMAASEGIYLGRQPADSMRDVLLHEAQHYIQEREGFALGGSSRQFLAPKWVKAQELYDKGVEKGHIDPTHPEAIKYKQEIDAAHDAAYEKYTRLMGEVESRNVEVRRNLSASDRTRFPPHSTEDVARADQIHQDKYGSAKAGDFEGIQGSTGLADDIAFMKHIDPKWYADWRKNYEDVIDRTEETYKEPTLEEKAATLKARRAYDVKMMAGDYGQSTDDLAPWSKLASKLGSDDLEKMASESHVAYIARLKEVGKVLQEEIDRQKKLNKDSK
jgi:hypothetical protein